MEKKFEMTPEMKAKIDAKIKEIKEKEEHGEIKPLNLEALNTVAGGTPGEFDPNATLSNGMNYDDVVNILCWINESYYEPGAFDYARKLTLECAKEITGFAGMWDSVEHLPYPDFVYMGATKLFTPGSYSY